MKVYGLLFLMFFVVATRGNAGQTYFTDVYSNLIKSLQVKVADELISSPYIELEGDRQIQINFDVLEQGIERYCYSVIHCDASWQKSILSPIQYMSGFQGLTIDDYATSISTTTGYTNYNLLLPNEDVQFKVSGNYAVQIYKEDAPDRILLTACFSVVEPKVEISASVSGNTDIDTNRSHQQVSFSINTKNFSIPYPQTDLKVLVYQNNRRDNAVSGIQPTSISDNKITYSNNRSLIFPAGNEYRRTEFLSTKYNGMHVEHVSFHNPYYNVELTTDLERGNQTYQYDQDQDGRFFIRCSSCDNPETEADYFIVHFTLDCEPLLNGSVYLSGDLFHNVLDEKSKMGYNFETKQYEKAVLLKQGSYNYQYLFVPGSSSAGETGPIEGDYYQTENEYTICAYYHPMGAHYDRLIGIVTIKNAMQVF